VSESHKRYYQKNKEKFQEYTRNYYTSNRDKILYKLKIKADNKKKEKLKDFGLTGCFSVIIDHTIKIPLGGEKGRGKFLIIDQCDFYLVNEYRWSLGATGYTQAKSKGIKKISKAHRVIMKVLDKSQIYIDHINGNRLDNRRCNLRICTISQNQMNRTKIRNTSSIFKGVTRVSKRNKNWMSQIKYEGIRYCLGYYKSEEEAARAYDKKAKELFGEFAKLNFAA